VFVLSQHNYCNSVLAGLPRSTTEPLQRVLNAATQPCRRLETIQLCNTGVEVATLVAHQTPYQIQTVPAHALSAHQQSAAVSDRHRHYSCRIQCTAGLRSADTAAYAKPRTRTSFGERDFCFAGPVAWNSLPSHLHSISDTIVFKHKLKREPFLDKHLTTDSFYQRSWPIMHTGTLEIFYVFICICIPTFIPQDHLHRLGFILYLLGSTVFF